MIGGFGSFGCAANLYWGLQLAVAWVWDKRASLLVGLAAGYLLRGCAHDLPEVYLGPEVAGATALSAPQETQQLVVTHERLRR